jgi:signal transduction histidine kinase
MILTLPEEVRQLLHQLHHHVFMIYRSAPDEYRFLFSEGLIAEQYGLLTRHIRNQTLTEIFLQSTYQTMLPYIEKAFQGQSCTFEMKYKDRWMHISLHPVMRGKKIEEISGTALDIQTMKEAEHELRAALEKEKHLGMLKSRFVYTVSHEFRTPLTGISIAAEMIKIYKDKLDESTKEKLLEDILSRTYELTRLIEDLLEQSAASSMAAFLPQPCNPENTCRELIRDFEHAMPGWDIKFDLISALPESVMWDLRLIKHILRNLLSNACKYSAQGSAVLCSAGLLDEEHIFISVQDFGVGISPEDLPHIFTPYYRSRATEKIKGTGLGLSIVKEFVELHAGRLTVQSEPGKGSIFTAIFPIEYKRIKI